MESVPGVFLIPIIIIGAVVLIAFGMVSARKRREAMAALAAQLGYSFTPGRDRGHDDRYRQFSAFRRGRSRYAYNTITGECMITERRYAIRMGDYHYTTGSGKNRRTHNVSYLLAHLPFPTPGLIIRRENVLDKLGGAIGFDDIDFESEEFSRAFYVKGPNRRFAYDVLDPRMIEFLLGSDPPSIEIDQGVCLILRASGRWRPQQFRHELGWLAAFFEHWPDHVTRTLDARGQS